MIGKIENESFDCKKGRYNLLKDLGKFELAKDVASFANLDGGYIMIGPQTKKSSTYFGDEVTTISLCKQSLINSEQYLSIISDWIYPEVEGLNVKWYPDKNNKNKGIVVIEIPTQKEVSKPFLIKTLVDGRKIREIIFGYVKRKGASIPQKQIQEVHTIMRDGMLYDENIKARFDALEMRTEKIYTRIGEPRGLWGRISERRVFRGLSPQTLSEEIEQIIEEKLGHRF